MDERPSRVGAADTGLVSRRTVNLGAAWSVPVVLAAVAAPADVGSRVQAATSGSLVHQTDQTFTLTLNMPSGTTGVVTLLAVSTGQGATWTLGQGSGTIAGGQVVIKLLLRTGNNAGKTATVSYSVAGGPTQTIAVPVS